MEGLNLFTKLSAALEYSSEVEKKIASEILSNPNDFITSSMAELSKKIGVSQGSINNFAQKACGGGFAALKLQIASQLSTHKQLNFSDVSDSDNAKDILHKTINQTALAFENTLELNSEETLKAAADLILNAKKIELYGIYISGIVANSFYFHLFQLGLPASYVSDVLLCPVSATLLDENDVVIAISNSGQTKDIIDAVEIAKDNGAKIICLTSNPLSPLAKLSDITLHAASCGTNVGGISSEVEHSQMILADAICSYIRHRVDKDGENRYYKLSKILNSHSIND